jgi:lipoprotein-anchoring transpeptidase ErfK/SrfK
MSGLENWLRDRGSMNRIAGIAVLSGFVALVGAAGYLLVQEPAGKAVVLSEKAPPPISPTGEFAKPGNATPAAASAKPRDERFVIKRILPITGPIKYGEWHWNEAGAPAEGPLVMTVDLDARVLSVFRGGYEIGATAVLLGTQEKPTPLGKFPIIWKKADHYSSIYDGAPMPFTHRLTNDGIAIHGTKVEKGYASHGCIGVPNDFGKKLFGITKLGDVVYITKGKRIGKGDSLVEG